MPNIGAANRGPADLKTNGLVVGHPVAHVVYLRQFVKYQRLIVLNQGRTAGFGGKYLEQGLVGRVELRLCEQVAPQAKVHLSYQFMMRVQWSQSPDTGADNIRRFPTPIGIKHTARGHGVAEPVIAQPSRIMRVHGIAQSDFKAADNGVQLLRQAQVEPVERHGFFRIVATGAHVAAQTGSGDNLLKIGVFHEVRLRNAYFFRRLREFVVYLPHIIPGSP